MNRDFISDLVKRHEGKKNCLYTDTRGVPTIGIGCNLLTAQKDIEHVGANYERILHGEDCLTDEQVENLFDIQLSRCISKAAMMAPDYFDLPNAVQAVMADMVFNVGEVGYRQFVRHLEAIRNHDYKKAAEELMDSRWYGQVNPRNFDINYIGNRGTDNVRLLKEAAA